MDRSSVDATDLCPIPSHVARVLSTTNGLHAVHLGGFAVVIPFPQAGLFGHFDPSLSSCSPQVPAESP